ncbi:hypothetical protein BJY00DRAFT_318805 [Aspergillus carlsbadensis]|nr:hypothetical protein BJY00DRAFT_318805 [Aspergillus carlsbadensis]
MHIHKMNLLLAAIWLAMMAVGVLGDAIPTSVDGGLDNTEPTDTTTGGIKLTGWGIIHTTKTFLLPPHHSTTAPGHVWNDAVDDNASHPHAKKAEAQTETDTDVEVDVESVPLCGNGRNDSEDGLHVPGIPFHPGHGHHPTPCPSDRARPTASPVHLPTARGVAPRDDTTSISTSLSTATSDPTTLSTVTTHENIDLCGNGWNDSEDGLQVPGIPFQPGHGHHPTPCPSSRSTTSTSKPLSTSTTTATLAPRDVTTSVFTSLSTSTVIPTTLLTVASPVTHEDVELCGDGWNDSEDGLQVPGIPFQPGHGHHPTPCPSPVNKLGKRDELSNDVSFLNDCFHRPMVNAAPLRMAIHDLENRQGTPWADSKKCRRVWCQEEMCIKWCNESKKAGTLKSYKEIALDIAALFDMCGTKNGMISGEMGHVDWRTIIHWDLC